MGKYSKKDIPSLTIREAIETDAPAINDIIKSIVAEKYYFVPERSREDWDEAIRDIKSRNGLIIVAQVSEKTVGMATLVQGRLEKDNHVGFLGIGILRASRGIGIGTAMMNYMIGWAEKQEGLEKISLSFLNKQGSNKLVSEIRFQNRRSKQKTIQGRRKIH